MTTARRRAPIAIDPAGLPFIVGALLVGLVVGATLRGVFATPFVVAALLFLFFFRDPVRSADRGPTAQDNAVLAPADGRVLVAGAALPDVSPPGTWQQISIFLSPMDVHVNRIPVSGRVSHVSFTPGGFLPAYGHTASRTNERSEIWIDHHGQTVIARQIVGILARRVVCRVESGAPVEAGERFGIMKFGSRMDVFVPQDAEITAQVGQSVRGGETVVAVLH